MLATASFLFTKLIGINEKVNIIEIDQRKQEFREQNKDRINSMVRLYKFQSAQEIYKETDIEAQQYYDHAEAAKKSWKGKKKSEHTLYEQDQYLLHKISRLNKLTTLTLLFLSVMTALLVLNFSVITIPIILLYFLFLSILEGIGLLRRSFLHQQNKINQEIYPESVQIFFKKLNAR